MWKTTATSTTLRWPSFSKPDVRVRRNRPSKLTNGRELDRCLLADLRDESLDSQVYVDACSAMHKEAKKNDLPWLQQLLHDPSALVREAAAWPIADLEGWPALRDLLIAFQRGLDEGDDQDGFATLLIDLVSSDPAEAKRHLDRLQQDGDDRVRENAQWLLQHCDAAGKWPQPTPEP